jgi:hypothetical protein
MSLVPQLQWIRQSPTFNTISDNYAMSIAVDALYNSYVTYWVTAGAVSGQSSSGSTDIVILKIDPVGNVVWVVQRPTFNTPSPESHPRVKIDSSGDLVIVYMTGGTVSGQTKTGATDVVVMKMDTYSELIWIKQQPLFNGTGNNYNPSHVIDSMNNIYVAYQTDGTVSGQTNCGLTDIVVFKMNALGHLLWIQQNPTFNTSNFDWGPSIAVDSVGQIYVAYETRGVISGQTNSGSSDIAIFKMDTNGLVLWTRQNTIFNTPLSDEYPSIIVDPNGNIYVSYITYGTVSGQTNTGSSDIVVMKIDSSGNVVWLRQNASFNTSGTDDQYVANLNVDQYGGIYVMYYTNGKASGQTNTGNTDIVIFHLDLNGDTLWVMQQPTFNTVAEEYGGTLTVDNIGNIYCSYFTFGTVSGQTRTGNVDIVVAKFLVSAEYHPSITYDPIADNIYYVYSTNLSSHPAQGGNDIVITKKRTTGATVWSKKSAVVNATNDNIKPVLVFNDKYLYLVYQTSGVVSGGVALFPYDIVVSKLDLDGNVLWITQQPSFNTTRNDEDATLDVDQYGDVYLAYQTYGRISGGYRMGFKDRTDLVVFKVNTNGQFVWSRQSPAFNTYWGSSNPNLKCDTTNSAIYIAYTCGGPIPGQNFSGYTDITIMKMNYNGQILTTTSGTPWVVQQPVFDTTLADDHAVLCIDHIGYVYLCYATTGALNGFSNTGMSDLVICKFKSNGQVVKITQNSIFNTIADDTHPSMCLRNGFLYIAYQTNGTVSGQTNVGRTDLVVMKVNAITLGVIWIRQGSQFNTSYDETNPSITVDTTGNCYISYETTGNMASQTYIGHSTVVVCRINNDGTFAWVRK